MAMTLGVGLATLSGCNDKPAPETDSNPATTKEAKTVAITQIVEHPSLDEIRRGIIEELAANDYVEGKNLTVNFQSAQGNTATAGQIAKQFAGDMPDAIIAYLIDDLNRFVTKDLRAHSHPRVVRRILFSS